jgi:hypothetical protein
MGVYSLTWSAALVCAPQMGMRLFGLAPAALWLTCGALAVLAAAIIMPLSRVGGDGPTAIRAQSGGRSDREKSARTLGEVESNS